MREIFPQNHFKKFQQGLETTRFDVQLTSSSSPQYKLKITEELTNIKYDIYVKHVLKPFTRQLIYESSIWKLRQFIKDVFIKDKAAIRYFLQSTAKRQEFANSPLAMTQRFLRL